MISNADLENITVVIPHYESFDQAAVVIQCLMESGISGKQIVVVDDHSNDGSFEKLNTKFENVTFKRNKQNMGAGYCRNVGLTYSPKEYILFIDSDISFNNSALNNLLMDKKEYDIVFPKILHYDGTIFSPNNIWEEKYCFCSSVFLIKKEAINRLDEGFDINYKIFNEDSDFFIRCKAFGLKFQYRPEAIFNHPKKTQHSESRYYLTTRNVIYFTLKIGGIIKYKVPILTYCLAYTLMNLVMALLNRPILFFPFRIQWDGKWSKRSFARARLIFLFLGAIAENITKLPVILKKRRQLKKSLDNLSSTNRLSRIGFYLKGLVKPGPGYPRDLIFFVTNKCNLRCAHCFLGNSLNRGEEEDLRLGEIQQIARLFKSRLHSLVITGGEPFLRNDALDICKYFDKHPGVDQITVTTSGYHTSRIIWFAKNFLKNVKAKLLIQISLDGTADIHNKIRRDLNSFERALKTSKELQEIAADKGALETSFLMTLHSENYKEISRLHKLTSSLQIPLTFELVRNVSFFKTNGNHWAAAEVTDTHSGNLKPLNVKQLKEITPVIKNVYRQDTRFITGRGWLKDGLGYAYRMAKWSYLLNLLENKLLFKCSAGSKTGIIYSVGKIALCELTKSVGSLRENNYSFNKIWESEEANNLRDRIKKCFCTHGCFIYDNMNFKIKTGVKIINNLIKYYYTK